MIVYCEKCNSKFQVDDAKIPDTGIKARCSVCSHAFVLKKEPVVTTSASPPGTADRLAQGEPVQAQAKSGGTTGFDASMFNDAAPERAKRQSPLMGSGGPFFSRFAAETAAKPVKDTDGQGDVVVEITDNGSFDDATEIYETETQGAEGLADAFSKEPAMAGKPESEYDAFATFVERHKQDPEPAKAAAEAMSATRVPEVVTSVDGQPPANQISNRAVKGIMTKLDAHGMNDDYVVQMVQEICQAVKYVEGVEKPDWTTRMMGLDMLCKIRGLYAGEKKEDPANRQLQIVTGINM
ncbi:zinc-ribbon domain-containing protein [Geotalea toluenoxydans]|uniref:zinc-ribbon domain-containing protein n=1 Tax=Geotalea toluenoxydans TaxID=421624 RepID=UPI0006D0927C|nr:zinc-ribbon domain-containing protein [Geotalea toluenoxydans]